MKHLMFFVLFSLASLFNAYAENSLCFEIEGFSSAEEWEKEKSDWEKKETTFLRLDLLWKAKSLNETEKLNKDKIKNGRHKHCYMGCRVAQSISYETALHLGWLKENRALTDCKAQTQFQKAGLQIFTQGANFGKESSEPQTCFEKCVN